MLGSTNVGRVVRSAKNGGGGDRLRKLGSASSVNADLGNAATEIDAGHAIALTLRGWLHALGGRFDLAVRQFRRAVEADDGSVLDLSGLAWAYVSLDELDEAEEWTGRFSTLAPVNRWSANSRLILHWARG